MFNSTLHDETTFYSVFLRDIKACREEVFIESPFITERRAKQLTPVFNNLLSKGVKIYIMTRDPKEHEENMEYQSEDAVSSFERMGIQVLLCTGNHHRKLEILDRKLLWEGSLNILSQNKSREIMRRIDNRDLTEEMFKFLKLQNFL